MRGGSWLRCRVREGERQLQRQGEGQTLYLINYLMICTVRIEGKVLAKGHEVKTRSTKVKGLSSLIITDDIIKSSKVSLVRKSNEEV